MVELLPYGTDIPVATKLSILRPACYKKFSGIINEVYDRFEKGTGAPKRVIDSKPEMEDFLRETILAALGDKAAPGLKSDTDLFAYGVDSLQATRVRNVISKSLEVGDITLGQNIVYEHPSISQLARYLLDAKAGSQSADSDSPAATHKLMLSLVDKWASQLVKQESDMSSQIPAPEGEVVVLTGATGSLGAHILDQLTRRSDVATIICLSRAKTHQDSLKRVQDSLRQRQRVLSPSAMSKIKSLAADVNKPDLGLEKEEYESLRLQSTAVIHNAWPVNFVLSLASFDEHIGGAVNLLNLALRSPRKIKPAFFFSSSVGTVQGRPDPVINESFSDDPVTAGGMGYGRSKWVVEKLLERAGSETNARVGVLRIGQLAGDTET
jgi:NAD(P)-dependent dehydrogenase (short-subunit alcohol dehydrogenase family)